MEQDGPCLAQRLCQRWPRNIRGRTSWNRDLPTLSGPRLEEAPDAYKDIEAVGQDLVDAGVANIAGWCRARISYKVRNEAR
jgi:hypothetical protein